MAQGGGQAQGRPCIPTRQRQSALPRRFVVLAVLLLGYNTVLAMVFAGTVRYRAPFDFLLAILAAAALVRAWDALRGRRESVPA